MEGRVIQITLPADRSHPDWWDLWLLGMAKYVSSGSKDPSTQTGAVITRANRSVKSVGFNGFAMGCDDDPKLYLDREIKYERIIHCEMNAVLFAEGSLAGCTLYTYPFLSCARCCVHMIQAGIKRAVGPFLPAHLKERWEKSIATTKELFAEAGVVVSEYQLAE
jgi:dCMP deaminase